jgi:1-acyl-sn-glycerol-3-phosphate acyltransferase
MTLRQWWYRYLHLWSVILASTVFPVRTLRRRHVPRRGGVIIACNHQSYLDPVLVGLGLSRQINYLARRSLFRHWRAFSWLMLSLNAIPVRHDGSDVAAFRESVRRLRAGEVLLVFPEGTRTPDGEVGRLLPGVWNMAHRARVPVVPAVIDGAFEAWPRSARLPRPHRIRVMYGGAVSAAELDALGSEGLRMLLTERLRGLLKACRAVRRAVDPGILGSKGQ